MTGKWFVDTTDGWMAVKAYGKTERYYIKDGKPVKGDYAGNSGVLYTGEHQIDGKTYWFNSMGVWIK